MMVENRFNAISLWTLHPFTYMHPGEELPRGQPLDLGPQLEEWRWLYRGFSAWPRSAGSSTYVVHWSIFVSEPFARAMVSPWKQLLPHYYVPGHIPVSSSATCARA